MVSRVVPRPASAATMPSVAMNHWAHREKLEPAMRAQAANVDHRKGCATSGAAANDRRTRMPMASNKTAPMAPVSYQA